MEDLAHIHTGTTGDDLFTFGLDDLHPLAQSGVTGARFIGGAGQDTLQLTGEHEFTLDLTKIDATRLLSIEQIDLARNSASDTLILNVDNVFNLNDQHQLIVLGDESDTLQLATGPGGWHKADTPVTTDEHSYDVYLNVPDPQSGVRAQVFVSTTMHVIDDNPPHAAVVA